MKILSEKHKEEIGTPKLSKDVITKLGNVIYKFEEVKRVDITVEFEDNSSISFEKDDEFDMAELFDDDE